MALYRIEEFFPNYQQELKGRSIKKYTVYAGTTDVKIGSISDILVDEKGKFRYFVVETGFWIVGKQILLPVGRALVDLKNECIYALGIKGIEQVENLPEYHDDLIVDFDYEEKVRVCYRINTIPAVKDTYRYDSEPELFQLQGRFNGDSIKLYEERLITYKQS